MKIRLLAPLSITLALGLTLTSSGCAPTLEPSDISMNSGGSVTANGPALAGKMKLAVRDGTGSLIYSDSVLNSSLRMKAGEAYSVVLEADNPAPGTTFKLIATQTNILSGTTEIIPLQLGSNSVSTSSQGDFAWKLVASAPGFSDVSQTYIAEVSCANPTFTAASLNPNGLTVASGGGSNLYNFNAANVAAGANGMGPYTCALDPTGTAIQSTSFRSCATAFNNVYVNYVGNRTVGVLVKDSCNTTHSVTQTLNLPFSVPAMPGNVFIFGQTSNATGVASGDDRVDAVTYLATNSGGFNIVQPQYGSGVFRISATMNYQMLSSVNFGMQIYVKGITDTIDVRNGTGTISAAGAYLDKVVYSTDQSGDGWPAALYSSSSCTLSNQNARVIFVSGQPCAAGQTGSTNRATVEVWGHYVCNNMMNAGGAFKIEGDFNGAYTLVDNCIGGGGGGGGGIVPIKL